MRMSRCFIACVLLDAFSYESDGVILFLEVFDLCLAAFGPGFLFWFVERPCLDLCATHWALVVFFFESALLSGC